MKNLSSYLMMGVVVATTFFSCNQSDALITDAKLAQTAKVEELNPLVATTNEKTSYTTDVSVDDARKVASLFNQAGNGSRALKVIKEIKVMKDDNGTPSIYVVNFANNQGFVLISATRNFLPVLAYNDEGNFTVPEEKANGLSLWMEKTKRNVKIANALPADSTAQFRAEWEQCLFLHEFFGG